MSLINKEVNDFEVKAFQNDEFKTVKKEDILGKWSVFFFYPADFTFVCPTELLIEEDGLAERGTFVVNPEGKIVAYEVNAGNVGRNADELLRKVQACQFVYTHGDEVCPAKWEPGKETLKPSLDLVGQL